MKASILTAIASVILGVHSFELRESFRQPKNIMFGAVGGGSSHINWVLQVLDELSDRGHNVTFITHDDELKYGKEHPKINTISLGPNDVDLSIPGNRFRHIDNALFLIEVFKQVHNNYGKKMTQYKHILESTAFDVALCDHFTVPCIDVAQNMNVPFIVTSSVAVSKDATAPYINNFIQSNDSSTKDMSFFKRMLARVVEPLDLVLDLKPVIDEIKKEKQELGWLPTEGMPAFEDNWQDSLKLVNNLFGFEPPRPLGPLVELVGPIMSKSYPDLTSEQQQFLDSHQKVAYVAFGQHVQMEDVEVERILTAIMNAIDTGDLDGFIWATGKTSHHLFPPHNIVTEANKSYVVEDLLQGRYKHAQFLTWAPQMAILSHPSTRLFVSHAGLASLHEAVYAGVRTALYPFYGDQMSNAYMMRTLQLGVQLSHDMDQPTFNHEIQRIASDADGVFQQNVNRLQAMVQIHAQRGVAKAADMVEEVLFASDRNGKLPHRYSDDRFMSYIKAHNLDLWGFWIAFGLMCAGMVVYSFRYVYQAAWDAKETYDIRQKQKAYIADLRKEAKKAE